MKPTSVLSATVEFDVHGREALLRKFTSEQVEKAVRKINQAVGWEETRTNLCLSMINDPRFSIFMAEDEAGALVGYGIVVIKTMNDQFIGPYLEYLAVVEKTKGIGTALLVTICNELLEKKCSSLHLKCHGGVLGFYQKFGDRINAPVQFSSLYENMDGMYVVSLNLRNVALPNLN